MAYLTHKHDTFLLLSVLVTEQLTGLQLQSMGTGSSWFTVFSGLGVLGLASLCAIFIPSAHPSSKVQYVGLLPSVSLAGWLLSQLRKPRMDRRALRKLKPDYYDGGALRNFQDDILTPI